jgi:hypothetical protein
MLYEVLTGRAPYLLPGEKVSPHTVLGLVLHGPPLAIDEITRSVPSELVAICEKAMAREQEERYAGTLELAEDLRAYLENRVVAAYETGSVAEFKKWVSRNKGLAASTLAAGVAVLVGLGAVVAVQTRANRDLLAANVEIEDARDELIDSNEELGRTNEELAAATEHAVEKEREARIQGYSANMAAAAASLRDLNVKEAMRRLDLCDEELRGWEWRRLRLEADSSLWYLQLERGQGTLFTIGEIAFSPDGSRIALATGAARLMIVDAATSETVLGIDHGVAAAALAWTPDGAKLVTGASDRRVRVWSAETGEKESEFRAHRSAVWADDVSPDGRRRTQGVHVPARRGCAPAGRTLRVRHTSPWHQTTLPPSSEERPLSRRRHLPL